MIRGEVSPERMRVRMRKGKGHGSGLVLDHLSYGGGTVNSTVWDHSRCLLTSVKIAASAEARPKKV